MPKRYDRPGDLKKIAGRVESNSLEIAMLSLRVSRLEANAVRSSSVDEPVTDGATGLTGELRDQVSALEQAVFAPSSEGPMVLYGPGTCSGCTFSDEPWHDLFLKLETSHEPWLYFFAHSESEEEGPDSFNEIASFIRCHNWHDPNAMEMLAQQMSFFIRASVLSSRPRKPPLIRSLRTLRAVAGFDHAFSFPRWAG